MTAPLAGALLRASLEGAAFVLLVALVTRVARLPAAARCALWWVACLRLLVGAVGLPAIAVPEPHAAASIVRAVAAVPARTPAPDAPAPVVPRLADAAGAPAPAANGQPVPWGAILLACWLAGVLATAFVHARDLARLARTWRDATPVDSPHAHAWLARWLGDAHAARVELRAHPAVGAPLILAGARPRILLPASCLDHDPARLRMALAHEAAHVRRRDLAWGLVPALAHTLFWFHPLARWCVSEYAQSREEACDADALALSRGEAERYGALLVEFGIDRSRAVHAAASCGSHHVRQLTRRIHMLAFASRPSRTQRIAAATLTCAVALLAAVSVRFVRAAVTDDAPPPVPAVTAPAPVAPLPPAAVAPAAPATPFTPFTPFASRTSRGRSASRGYGYSYSTGEGRDFSYGYTDGDGNTTMHGNWSDDDDRWLDDLRDRGSVAWFRVNDATYVVEDADDVERLREIMRPTNELGEQQGRLGEQQSALGEKQSALGDKQRDLGEKMRDLSERLQDVEERLADRRGRDRDELEQERDEIHERIEECSRMMNELGARQGELGGKQGALGRQQGEIGRKQAELSRAARREAQALFERLEHSGRLTKLED